MATRQIPHKIGRGDTIKIEDISYSDYPSNDGWSLYFQLCGVTTDVQATAVADASFDLLIPASVTADYTLGDSNYALYVSKGSPLEVYTVEAGVLDVCDRVSTEMSHARRALAALEAVLEKRASNDQLSYSIGNRSISKMSGDELLKWKNHYKRQVQVEDGTARKTIEYYL